MKHRRSLHTAEQDAPCQYHKSRFAKGHFGRPKSLLSEQTRLALKERLKDPRMIAKMRMSGLALAEFNKQNRYGK